MADYSKMKNAELEKLLKERGLPHTGKKAELVQRLQENDANGAKPAESKVEDEIDWDDEPVAADAKKATNEPAAAAIEAGGTGQAANPQAVPNQVADVDPAQTNDLKVEAVPATDATTTSEAAPVEEAAKPPVDFTSGLKMATIDEEIAKRKARAKKFGIEESSDDALKALERAKRFGGAELSDRLNEALPDRKERKRGRGPEDTAGNQQKRGRPGVGGRRGSGRPNNERASTPKNAPAPKTKPDGGVSGYSEADRQKAEARKARFAAAT